MSDPLKVVKLQRQKLEENLARLEQDIHAELDPRRRAQLVISKARKQTAIEGLTNTLINLGENKDE